MAEPFTINPTDEVGSGTAVGAAAGGEGGEICSFCGKMKRTEPPEIEEIDAHEYCKCEILPSLGMELLAITDEPTAGGGEGGVVCASCGKMKRTVPLEFEETRAHDYCECESPSSSRRELLKITDATTSAAEGGVICALCGKMKRTLLPKFEETNSHEYCECESPSSSGKELLEITDATTVVAPEGGVICASCGKIKRTIPHEFEETAAPVKEDQNCNCESPSASGRQSLSSEEGSSGENIPELSLDDLVKNFGVPEGFLLKGLVPEAYNHPSSEEAAEECSICTEKFQNGDVLGRMLCTHKFHFDCIKRWLMEKNFCPNCKNIAIELWNLE